MDKQEIEQREKLIAQIEGYYGPMKNIHKLSTGELLVIFASIKELSAFHRQSLVKIRKEMKNNS